MAQHIPAWRLFKRMQVSAAVFAALLYAGVSLQAWSVLDWPEGQKRLVMLYGPALFAALTLIVPLTVPPIRRVLKRYVWLSFAAGFGQSVVSVVTSLGVVSLAAVFIWLQVRGVASGGRPPTGIFSAFGAGMGVLAAQVVLCLRLEREPEIRRLIEQG